MYRPIRGQANIRSARKTQTCWRTLWICFLSCFEEFWSAVSKELSKISQPIRGQCSHFFPSAHKYKLGRGRSDPNSYKVVVEFGSVVSEEKSIKSQSIRGQCSNLVFPDWSEKHKLRRGRWDLVSCQVSLEFRLEFSEKSKKKNVKSKGRTDDGQHNSAPWPSQKYIG